MSSTPNADTSHEQPSFTDALSGTTFARSFSLDDLEQPDTAAALSQDSINIQHSSEISDIKAMMLSMHSMLININDTNAMAASSTRLHVSDPSKAAANAISAPPASSSDMLLKRLTLDSAHEKDATRKYSLSSMDSAPLQAFLAAFKSYAEHVESSRPVLDFISFSVHGILKKRLGLPADTNLKSYFGVALGTDQPLLQALRTLAFPAKTSDKFKVLKDIHMMQPCSIFSPSDIESLFLQMKDFIGSNPLIFGTDIACLYPTMVECIQPVHFRTILKKYSSSYTNSSMSFSEFCTNVIDYHLNRYDTLLKLTADYGPVPVAPSPKVSSIPDALALPASSKPLHCMNCSGSHLVRDCTEVCQHCQEQVRLKVLKHPCGLPPRKCHFLRVSKSRSSHPAASAVTATCHPDASATPALAMPSDTTAVSQFIAVPQAITLSSVSSLDSQSHPISSDIFFDTGANRLFVHSKELCSSIEDRPLLGSVSLPDGKRLPVTTLCTVKSASGLYCPTFDKTLVPAPLLTGNNLAVLVDTELIVIPLANPCSSIIKDAILHEQHSYSSTSTVAPLTQISRKNGLYPLSREQFFDLCIEKEPNGPILESPTVLLSTYYTVRFGPNSDLVRFWHEALGHPSKTSMKSDVRHGIYEGIPPALSEACIEKYFNDDCEACIKATMSQHSSPQVASPPDFSKGEICSLDIGHWTEKDFAGNTYSIHAKDLKSDKSFGYLLSGLTYLEDYLHLIHCEYLGLKKILAVFRLDKQFYTAAVVAYCIQHHIALQLPAPYEHASNGDAEALVKHDKETVNKLLEANSLESSYWGLAFLHTLFLRCIRASKSFPTASRNERWGLVKHDLSRSPLLPFGADVLAHRPLQLQTTLSRRAFRCKYVGQAIGIKGGISLRNTDSGRIISRRTFRVLPHGTTDQPQSLPLVDIEIPDDGDDGDDSDSFDENSFQFQQGKATVPPCPPKLPRLSAFKYDTYAKSVASPTERLLLHKIGLYFSDTSEQKRFHIVDVVKPSKGSKGLGSRVLYFRYYDIDLYPGSPLEEDDYEYTPCSDILKDTDILWNNQLNSGVLEASAAALEYYESNVLAHDWTGENSIFSNYLATASIASSDPVYIASRASFSDLPPPRSLSQVSSHPEGSHYWKAFTSHLDRLRDLGNLEIPADIEIGDIPPHLILQLMPIFRKKYNGINFSKFKCRLVVLGNRWVNEHGVDTYSEMGNMESLKIMLDLGARFDYEMFSFDVEEAFYTTVVNKPRPRRSVLDPPQPDQTYYARRPPGATDADMPFIVKPKCFIPGHPLANQEFNADLRDVCLNLGGVPTTFHSSVYVINNSHGSAIINTIVDDVPIVASSIAMKDFILSSVRAAGYTITVNDPLDYIFGLEVTRDRVARTVTLRQVGEAEDLLDAELPDWRTCPLDKLDSTPAAPPHTPSMADILLDQQPSSKKEVTHYQSIAGVLNWLTLTHLDIIHAHKLVAQKSLAPTALDFKKIHRLISYVAYILRTNDDGLVLGGHGGLDIVTTVDSSFASDKTLKSYTGSTIAFGPSSGAVCAHSYTQKLTPDSSMASEGIGAHLHVRKLLPIRYFVAELGFPQDKPTKYTTHTTNNP